MCEMCAATGTFDPGRHPNGGDFATIFEGVDAPANTSTPYSINVGDTFVGNLSFVGDRDYVAVTLQAGQTYTVNVSGAGSGTGTLSDSYLRVYDSSGNLIYYDDDSGPGRDSEVTFTAATSDTYYVSAGGYIDSRIGTYEITVESVEPVGEGTLDELADFLVSGYWESTGRSARSFDTNGSNQITVNIIGLTAEGQQLARWALEAWELVADIEVVFVSASADITFDDDASGAYNQSFTSGGTIARSVVNVSTDWVNNYGTTIDSYSFQTYVHEIGHALGLGHQGAYNGSSVYGTDETFSNDSWQISVMSYFDQSENTTTTASYARLLTPMMADITAIQSMYGASSATDGRTIYGANSNLGGYIAAVSSEIAGESSTSIYNGGGMAFTIYDGGGRDLIDFSFATQGMRIDLQPETFSDVGGLIGNMAIARGTIIEELFTGSGNDNILGNNANNLIRANEGADTIDGAGGNDRLYGGNNNDRLYGGSGSDKSYGQAGNDSLYMDAGNDTLDGGSGTDWLYVTGRTNSVVNLARTTGQNTGYGTDIIKNIENASGGSGVDKFYGTGGNNTLRGNNGNDLLYGQNGNDRLYGGNNNDKLYGGAGNDRLQGDAGRDIFDGGNGRDYMYAGNDADRDVFIFRDISETVKGTQRDRIYQFDSGEDDIHLRLIDANENLAGDQNFKFSSNGAAANSVWVQDSGSNVLVRGDVNGDRIHDFEIFVASVDDLYAYDFIL